MFHFNFLKALYGYDHVSKCVIHCTIDGDKNVSITNVDDALTITSQQELDFIQDLCIQELE
jgi:hypothetical protein